MHENGATIGLRRLDGNTCVLYNAYVVARLSSGSLKQYYVLLLEKTKTNDKKKKKQRLEIKLGRS